MAPADWIIQPAAEENMRDDSTMDKEEAAIAEQYDHCSYRNADNAINPQMNVLLFVQGVFHHKQAGADKYIANTVEGTKKYGVTGNTPDNRYWFFTGANWRIVVETAEFVSEYDPKTMKPKGYHYYAWKGRGEVWKQIGHCVLSVSGELFPPDLNYRFDPIPERGPYTTKQQAVEVGRGVLMRELAEKGEGLLAKASTAELQEFCMRSLDGTESAAPTPSPSPSPSPEPKCDTNGEIIFEPTQGVWQDDYHFADAPGKRIERIAQGQYNAELPMVVGRRSLIFGQRGAGAPDAVTDFERRTIKMKGTTTGTTAVMSRIKFSLDSLGASKTVYESANEIALPIGPPCGAQHAFSRTLPAGLGLPPATDFTFDSKGAYELKAELLRGSDSKPVGVQTSVFGNAVETKEMQVHFVATSVMPAIGALAAQNLAAWTRQLAQDSQAYIPDYFPLAQGPNAIQTLTYPVLRSYFSTLAQANQSWKAYWASALFTTGEDDERVYEHYRRQHMAAQVFGELSAGAMFGNADKIVVVIPSEEAGTLMGSGAVAISVTQKVVIVPYNINYTKPPHDTVAHELAHTMPFIWSADEMLAACADDYHNTNRTIAHGFRITYGGAPAVRGHVPAGGALPIMGVGTLVVGPAVWATDTLYDANSYTVWNDQCTYTHLADYMQAPVDPKLLLVRGEIARKDGKYFARLAPSYEFYGTPTLSANGTGSWRIVVRDASGTEGPSYAFEPGWELPTQPEHVILDLVSFTQAIPFEDNAASIEIYSSEGLEATMKLSANAPTVQITSPENNSNTEPQEQGTPIAWEAGDADGDALAYTVLYSSNGGESWRQEVFETTQTSAKIRLDDAPDHLVKVLATDGANSGEAVVAFSTRAKELQPTPEPQAASPQIELPQEIDFSFIPQSVASLLGGGIVRIDLYEGGTPASFWYELQEGGKAVRLAEPQGAALALQVSMTRSVFEAMQNSVDSQNAAKLAVSRDAVRINSPDAAKQAALGFFKQTVKGDEFNPAPGSEVQFRGKTATVVEGPAGRPALSIAGERFLPVMNRYGAPMGASIPGTAGLLAKAKESSTQGGAGEGFSQKAGVLAADPKTGKPVLEPQAESTPRAPIAAVKPARAAYRAGISARNAYRQATARG
jgi:hypothetical protein